MDLSGSGVEIGRTAGLAQPRWLPAAVALLLAAATVAVFYPVGGHDFVNFDDPDYVTSNPHVKAGLTVDGVQWAFSSVRSANWHPLTWISHMVDCQLFGLRAGRHHLMNVLFHAGSTVVLFFLLRRMTGAVWRSALAAALFALHPLHVESVAWIAERKDVLSGFFFMLTLWAYAAYVERSKTPGPGCGSGTDEAGTHRGRSALVRGRKGVKGNMLLYYALALVFFAMGLMSKPMLVTLPFILLLLDYWPLGRLDGLWARNTVPGVMAFSPLTALEEKRKQTGTFGGRAVSWAAGLWKAGGLRQLLVEKAPFFALTLASCVTTFLVQRHGGAVQSLAILSIGARVENAVVSYGRYLGKAVWPFGLATPYPYQGHWPVIVLVLAGGVLTGFSAAALWFGRKRPYWVTGWFWFVGMLVPVIGLVQVGDQAMADRYTYLPLIGLFIALAWTPALKPSEVRLSWSSRLLGVFAVVLVAFCAVRTRDQLRHWRNSEALFAHAASAVKKNWLAHYNLGGYLDERKRWDEAIAQYKLTVAYQPKFAEAWNNLGCALAAQGRYADASPCFAQAVKLRPGNADFQENLARSRREAGKKPATIAEYRAMVQRNPRDATALNRLGDALAREGKFSEAVEQYTASLTLNPNQATAHYSLGNALLRLRRLDEAIVQYRHALQQQPGYAEVHGDLGIALARKGRVEEGIQHLREAVRLNPSDAKAHCNLGIVLAGEQKVDDAIAQYQEALRLAPDNAQAHASLAVALAIKGDLDQAISHFQEALRHRPNDPTAHFNLGKALASRHQIEEARSHFNEALRLRPNYREAQEELSRLKQ